MDPLLAWRAEFPILETCTYLVSHSLGAMPRAGARRTCTQFADEWDHRGVRAWHEGWWEIGRRDRRSAGAGARRAAPARSRCTRTRPSRSRSSRRAFRSTAARRKIVLQDLDFPTNHYLFEGFRRYGAEIVYVESDDAIRAPIDRLVDAIDERTALVPMSLVLFRSALPAGRAARRRARASAWARASSSTSTRRAGAVPMDLGGARRGLRRRRIGEVAVRRPGRRATSTSGRT